MTPAAAAVDPILSKIITPLHVLVMLCKYRNSKTGECFPSVGRLARDFGKTRRTIQRHIDELLDKGYIMVKGRRSADGRSMNSNIYIILYPPLPPGVGPKGPADKDREDEANPIDEVMTPSVMGGDEAPQNTPSEMRHLVTPPMTLDGAPHDSGCRNNEPTGTRPLVNDPLAEAVAQSAPPMEFSQAPEYFLKLGARDGLTPEAAQLAFEQLQSAVIRAGYECDSALRLIDDISRQYMPRPGVVEIVARAVNRAVGGKPA